MATILEPSPTGNRAVAIRPGQVLRLRADTASLQWLAQVNSGGWTNIGAAASELFYTAPTSVTNHLTFDRLEITLGTGTTPDGSTTPRNFDLCEGPPAVLWVIDRLDNEALSEPSARPWEGEDDDPPLASPLSMLPASRGGLGTTLLETVSEVAGAGPSNLVASWGPGVFVDTSGALGIRTPFTNDARGRGPFPAIAAWYQSGLYFQHDFGKSRNLALTRVLYEESGAPNNVAVVRGDGRRNTYRKSGSNYDTCAASGNVLRKDGSVFTEITPSGRYYQYDSAGRLQKVLDRVGNTAYFLYDGSNRLQKINGRGGQDEIGLVPYLSYNASGLLERLRLEDAATPANNRETYFTYDGNRNLLRIVAPEGCSTYFEYSPATQLQAVTDPEGYRWYFAYDGSGRVTQVVDALGKTTYFGWTPGSALAAKRDRAAKVTYYRFGAFGAPEYVYNTGTSADYFVYDGDGQLARSRTRLGQDWYYQYDARFNRIAVTDPLGGRSYFAYDAQDLLRTFVDPVNRSTYLTFDAQRNRERTIDALGNTAYYEYESTGLLRLKKDRRGSITYMLWNTRGVPTQVTDPLQNTTYFAYNSANERTTVRDPLARVTYLEYDKRGRLAKQTSPIGAASYWHYDSRCNVVLTRDARQNTTTTAFDGNSNPVRVTDALGNETYLAYDAEERPSMRLNARLFPTYWQYDALGRRQRQIDAYGNRTYAQYDAAHEVTLQLNERGNPTYVAYDATGRPTVRKNAELNTTYVGYDNASQVVLSTDLRGFSTYFQYDPRGWQRQTKSAIGAIAYTVFDQEGNRLRSIDPLGLTTYFTYDAAGRLTHTTDQELGVTYTGYDAASQAVLRLDQRLVPSYTTYDLAGRTQVSIDRAGLVTYSQYDLVNNLIAHTLDQGGWGTSPWGLSPWGGQRATSYYTYDAINRRQRSTDPYGNATYMAYDKVGNLDFGVDERGYTTYHRYDRLDRRTHTVDPVHFAATYTAYDEVGNAVLQLDPQGSATYMIYDRLERTYFTYDRSGALTYSFFDQGGNRNRQIVQVGVGGTARTTTWEYDQVNRQLKQTAADTGASYFVHDVANNRTISIDPIGRPTYTVYDRLNRTRCTGNAFNERTYFDYDARSSVLQRRDPVGRTTYMAYDDAGRLAWQANALAEASYFHYDRRGSRIVVVNPRKFATYFRYDLLARQTHRQDALGGIAYTGYDAVGNRVLQEGPEETSFQGIFRANDTGTAIVRCNFDGSSATVVKNDANGTIPVAVDLVTPGGKLYWATSTGLIKRSNLDGTSEETVASSQYPSIMTLDPNGRRLYLSDLVANEVRALDLGSLSVSTVFSFTDLVYQTGVDPRAGKLYYANLIAGEIRRRNLDGTGNTLILNGLTQPQSIALDLVHDHLYFTVSLNTIQRMNLDGTNVVTIKSGINAGYLWVDPVRDRLFWNEFTPYALKSSKLDGTDTQTVATGVARMTLAIPQRVALSSYDGLRRMTHAKDALFATTYLGYDSRSSSVLRVDADGRAAYMTYDSAGRLSRQLFATPVAGETGDKPIYYVYDAVDNVRIVDDRLAGLEVSYFDYDVVDRLATKKTIAGGVYYAYDVSGKRSSLKDRDLTENRYVYDAAGRLVAEELAAGRSVYFEYDSSGMLTKRALPGDAVQAYWTYDRAGQLLNLVNRNPSAGVLCSFYYSRDAAGQITQIDREGGRRVYHEYDALDRLTLERQYSSTPAIIYGFSYSFDAASNRATKVDSVATQATYYSYDARNLLTKEYALQANVTTYYAHDAAQRMTSSRVTGSGQSAYFGHDQRSQIKRIDFTKSGGGADTIRYFGYNGLGERVRVVDDGGTETYWSYDGRKLLNERAASSTLRQYRYNQGNRGQALVESTNASSPGKVFSPASVPHSIVQQVDAVELIPRVVNEDDALGAPIGTKQTGITQVEHLRTDADGGRAKLASSQSLFLAGRSILLSGPGVESAPVEFMVPPEEIPPTTYGEEIVCDLGFPLFGSKREWGLSGSPFGGRRGGARAPKPWSDGPDVGTTDAVPVSNYDSGKTFGPASPSLQLNNQVIKLAYEHWLPQAMIDHYADGGGKKFNIPEIYMPDVNPADRGNEPTLSVTHSQEFREFVNQLKSRGGGSMQVTFTSKAQAGTAGTLGRFTFDWKGTLKMDCYENWIFDGEMRFLDTYDYDHHLYDPILINFLDPTIGVKHPIVWAGYLDDTYRNTRNWFTWVGATFLSGQPYPVESDWVANRQTSADTTSDWRKAHPYRQWGNRGAFEVDGALIETDMGALIYAANTAWGAAALAAGW